MQDESELAGALGHEIGHINRHHGLAAVQRAGLLGAALTASKNYVGQFNQISDAAGNAVLNVGFSQPEEYEADAEGVRYAAGAGYNPAGYLHFLQRMAAVQGGQTAPFSTHPGLGDRAARVADQITREHLGGKGRTNQARFLENVRLTGM
jgi:predicted Zn-dependent protease